MANKSSGIEFTIEDGVLSTPSRERKYVRALRPVWFKVEGVSYVRAFGGGDSFGNSERFSGLGTVDNGDSYDLLFGNAYTLQIPMSVCRAVPIAENAPVRTDDWHAVLGYNLADPEIRHSKASWWLETYLPSQMFDEIVAAWRRGEMRSFSIGVAVKTWVDEIYKYGPPLATYTHYLAPEKSDASSWLETADGKVVNFVWEEKSAPPVAPETPQAKLEEEPQPSPPAYHGELRMLSLRIGAIAVALAAIALLMLFRR